MHIVDRRLNPKSKSLGNRQRFMRRAKAHIREAVHEALKRRKISDVEGAEQISISGRDVREPAFNHDRGTGKREHVLPGNSDFRPGDHIRKPPRGEGKSGREGSPDGEGEDAFAFTLTREEFLDIFFEDLALPNLAKQKLKKEASPLRARAGFSTEGSPVRLNKVETMRRSLARRIALARPRGHQMARLEAEIKEAEARGDEAVVTALRAELERMRIRMRAVAYLDPIDIRYNRFDRKPRPTAQAVMFCLMDASASMTQDLKDLAKRFFMLLHVFLARHYREVDVVFIRHTTSAQEVDEETFFHGRATGGTVVSSALEEMIRIVQQRYPVDDWNIYAAQASDGHNFTDDMARCTEMIENEIMGMVQYFAYIEVGDSTFASVPSDSVLWTGYQRLLARQRHFAMRQVMRPEDIYPVFRELFTSAEASERKGGAK
ncbi:MAG: DUF444 family protein [Rhizobiales bacterium]|nr:DUF444 family protein [Hyphomicrobiales bacterium]